MKKKYRFNFKKAHWSIQGLILGLLSFMVFKSIQMMFLVAYVLAPVSQWQM